MSSREGSSDNLIAAYEDAPDIIENENLEMYFSSDEELAGAEEPRDAESNNDQEHNCPDEDPGDTESDNELDYPSLFILRSVENTMNDIDTPDLTVSDQHARPDLAASDKYAPGLSLSAPNEYSTDLTRSGTATSFVREVEPVRDAPKKEALVKVESYIGGLMELRDWRRNILPETFSDREVQVLSEPESRMKATSKKDESFRGEEMQPPSKLRNVSDTVSFIEVGPEEDALWSEAWAMDESHSGGDNTMRDKELPNIREEIINNLKMRLLSLREGGLRISKVSSPTSEELRSKGNISVKNIHGFTESSDDETSDCEFLYSNEFEGFKPAKMQNLNRKKSAGASASYNIEGASNLAAKDLTFTDGDNSDTSSVSEMEPGRNGDVRGGMSPMPKLKLCSVQNIKINNEGHSNTKDEPEDGRKMQLPLLAPSTGSETESENEITIKEPTLSPEDQTLLYDHISFMGRGSVNQSVPSLLKPQQSCGATKVGLLEKAGGEIRDIKDEGAVGGSRKQDFQLRKGNGEMSVPILLFEFSNDDSIDLDEIDEGSKPAKLGDISRKKKAIPQGSPEPLSANLEEISGDENDCSKILKNMRIKVEFQYIEEIDEINNKIENMKQINDQTQERELKHLKSKQILEKDDLVRKSNHEKVKLEQKKTELEKELAKTKKKMIEHEKQALKDSEGMDRRHKQEATALEAKIKDGTNKKEANLVKIRDDLIKEMQNYGNAAFPDDVEKLESARGILECPICMEWMKPPARIWMCPSNHLVCETCRDRLEGKLCPSCRTVRVNVRATVAENFSAVLFKE